MKQRTRHAKRHKKTKKKFPLSPLRIGNDMAPIGLHDIMQCYVLDSDKSILRGRCIRVWSILISILKIPAATLGFLFDYILYLFFSCFLHYLYHTILDVGSPSTTWDERRIIPGNSSNVVDGLRYPFHCRLAYSQFLSCLFPWFFYIPTFSHSFHHNCNPG